MSDNKQSSIEWFWNEVGNILPFSVDLATAIKLYDALQQAKAMHKEEHRKTYHQLLMSNFQTFEDYYKETFNG